MPDGGYKPLSGWTLESLKEHFEVVIEANDRRYEERFRATQEAIKKNDEANERRFEGANDAKAMIISVQGTAATKGELASVAKGIEDKIYAKSDVNRALLDALETKVNVLSASYNQQEGKGRGLSQAWTVLLGSITIIAVIFGIIARFLK